MNQHQLTDPGLYLGYIRDAIKNTLIYQGSSNKPRPNKAQTWEKIANVFKSCCTNGGKLMFIGNGGSAAIAGHMALDFSNAGQLKSVCFNDGPLLTCLANDYSYENVFRRAIEMYADPNDMLIAISSSGQSENIVKGVLAAKEKGCKVITLSGFSTDNSLAKLGDLNIYVPISRPHYGPVEVSHYIILHFLLDLIARKKPLKKR